MKTAFIINPVAGRGRTKDIWPQAKKIMEEKNLDFLEIYTEKRGHASQIAQQLKGRGMPRIIVVGGDGTLHEVINGLAWGEERPEEVIREFTLGMIPTGTGSDFYRSLKVPLDPLKAARGLFHSKALSLDLGKINEVFFFNVAGVGFDARVAQEINLNFKWTSGATAYVLALFKVLLTYRNLNLEIVLDEGETITTKSLLLAVGNARYYGGGMCIVPSALLDDGYFHLCIIGDIGKGELLWNLPKIFSGRHVEHKKVREVKAQRIEIRARERAVIHADGELSGYLPVRISILPGSLKFLVPQG
ncbi:MAG: diacylglycerol kinase family lipid kinase [Candidatus Syntrophonatronum acetioxidans]|uniref:Diacylglycerol kinase family lipid kinase n=1 Tax=Candidatus Syntrophonatronum acetioxidans TaxID=1795816 RepID=A0A424YFG8_9FIRM|nr:MAG: diacylglycerol kinase family lipid kinase [Candidatus Syntrophonatronum acetioxidans]